MKPSRFGLKQSPGLHWAPARCKTILTSRLRKKHLKEPEKSEKVRRSEDGNHRCPGLPRRAAERGRAGGLVSVDRAPEKAAGGTREGRWAAAPRKPPGEEGAARRALARPRVLGSNGR